MNPLTSRLPNLDTLRHAIAGLDLTHRSTVLLAVVAVLAVLAVLSTRGSARPVHFLAWAVVVAGFALSPLAGAVAVCVAMGYLVGRGSGGKVHGAQFTVAALITAGLFVALYGWARPAWWAAARAHTLGYAPYAVAVAVAVLVLAGLARLAGGGSGKRGKGARRAFGLLPRKAGVGPKPHNVPVEDRDPIRSASEIPGLTEKVLEDYDHTCAMPGCTARDGAPGVKLQMDHKHPWARGGRTERGNLQPLCGPHNGQKNDKTMEEYLAWHGAQR